MVWVNILKLNKILFIRFLKALMLETKE